MTKGQSKPAGLDWKALLVADEDRLRGLLQAVVQEVLEAEMTDAIGAERGERTPGRLGYRSGDYERKLVTRVGVLELRVPQDRQGRFSTELFERYQRSEKALVAALYDRRDLGEPDTGATGLAGAADGIIQNSRPALHVPERRANSTPAKCSGGTARTTEKLAERERR